MEATEIPHDTVTQWNIVGLSGWMGQICMNCRGGTAKVIHRPKGQGAQ